MPTALLDFQHELLNQGGDSQLVFGKVGTTYFTTEHPQIVPGDERFGDVDQEREDGTAMGEDYSSGKTVVFEIGVGTWGAANPHVANADALEAFETAWRNPAYRSNSGDLAVLRSRAVPGRTRRCYGRPRRYAETTSRATHSGYSTALCDFQTIDGKWYDDNLQTKTVGASNLLSSFTVGGTVTTWPVLEVTGPTPLLVVNCGPLTIASLYPIEAGQTVTFDPRPWKRTMLRNDGFNYAGKITVSTPPMRKWGLPPGNHQLRLWGIPGNGASVTLKWRSAFSRW